MELRQLQYFAVLAEELHFGRAAERLHIVQPAVTQQIQRLERSLGVDLFDRSRRNVQLMAAGERFVPEVRRVLDAVEHAVEVARSTSRERLEIGTTEGLGARLHAVLAEVVGEHPQMLIQLHHDPVEVRLQAVRTGRLDVAFVRGVPTGPDLTVVPLWRDPLVAVLPENHPLAEAAGVRLEQLRDLPLRLAPRERNPLFVDLVLGACRAAGFEPLRGPEFTTLQNTLAEIAVASPSWTVVSGPAAVEGSGISRVSGVPVHGPRVDVETSVVVASPTSARAGLVLEACRKIAASEILA